MLIEKRAVVSLALILAMLISVAVPLGAYADTVGNTDAYVLSFFDASSVDELVRTGDVEGDNDGKNTWNDWVNKISFVSANNANTDICLRLKYIAFFETKNVKRK